MGYSYNWQESSPLKQIHVAKNAGGWLQVVIYAPDNVDDKLAALPQYLTKQGFITYLDEVDGKHVLKVADFGKKEESVLDALKSGGFISGTATKAKIPDRTEKLGIIANIRKYSMSIGSAFGEIGHASWFTLGALTNDKSKMTVGTLYGTSTALTTAFGTGAGAIRFSEIVSGLHDYLKKEGIELPDPAIRTPEVVFRERNLATRTWDTVKTHPIQTTNTISLPGNALQALGGLQRMRENKSREGFGQLLNGTGAGLSALIASFVPEATPEKIEAYKKHKGFWKSLMEGHVGEAMKILPDSAYMLIARRPLAVQGTLLLADNTGMIYDALQASKNYKAAKSTGNGNAKFYIPLLTGITAATWTTASLFTAISSKHRDKSFFAYDGLYAQAANLLMALPEAERPKVIRKVSEYFSAEPEIHLKQEELERGLQEKMKELANNPWRPNTLPAENNAPEQDKQPDITRNARKEAKAPAPWMERATKAEPSATSLNATSRA